MRVYLEIDMRKPLARGQMFICWERKARFFFNMRNCFGFVSNVANWCMQKMVKVLKTNIQSKVN